MNPTQKYLVVKLYIWDHVMFLRFSTIENCNYHSYYLRSSASSTVGTVAPEFRVIRIIQAKPLQWQIPNNNKSQDSVGYKASSDANNPGRVSTFGQKKVIYEQWLKHEKVEDHLHRHCSRPHCSVQNLRPACTRHHQARPGRRQEHRCPQNPDSEQCKPRLSRWWAGWGTAASRDFGRQSLCRLRWNRCEHLRRTPFRQVEVRLMDRWRQHQSRWKLLNNLWKPCT